MAASRQVVAIAGCHVRSGSSTPFRARVRHFRSALNCRHNTVSQQTTLRADSVEKVGVSTQPDFFSVVGAGFRCGRGGPRHPPQTQRSAF